MAAFHLIQDVRIVNPFVFDHISGRDVTQSTTGWLFFQRAPWDWPIGQISSFMYPVGATIGYLDTFPLFSVLMKLILPASPPMQISGLWFALCFVLTGIFSWRIARRLNAGPFAAIGAAAIAVTCPVLVHRYAHQSLMGHWIVLAAMDLFLSYPPRQGFWRPRWSEVLVIIAGFGTHPYLGLIVLLILAGRQLVYNGLNWISWLQAASRTTILTIAAFLVLNAFGYFSIDIPPAGGFGHYNAPLFALFDSQDSSRFIPGYNYAAHGDGAYEGFAWLGPGGIVLFFTALLVLLAERREPAHSSPIRRTRPVFLLATCLVVFVIAMGSYVKVGSRVIATARGFYSNFEFFTSSFRSSGRLVWPLYYFVLIGSAAVVGRSKIPRSVKLTLITGSIVVQMLDQFPYYRAYATSPHHDPSLPRLQARVWQDVGERYRHIVMVPPQLDSDACFRFGRPDVYHDQYYVEFAWLAAFRDVTINSGSHARVSAASVEEYCNALYQDLERDEFDPTALYIVDPSYLPQSPFVKERFACSPADDVIVCIANTAGGGLDK